MADGTTQGGTAIVSGDEVTTENGVTVTARQVQRVKIDSVGADGAHRDVSASFPFPVSIAGFNPAYRLFAPAQAVGASKVFFDLFNATGSGKSLRILSVIPVVSGAVAVVGAVAVDLFLTRTTAVGTGGTAATADGNAIGGMTLSKMDPANAALPAGVTARLTPTTATAGSVIAGESVFTEETNAATYFSTVFDFVRRAAGSAAPSLIVPENTGMRVIQGTVASVGNIGFDVIFETY